jgi:hypothetical protein
MQKVEWQRFAREVKKTAKEAVKKEKKRVRKLEKLDAKNGKPLDFDKWMEEENNEALVALARTTATEFRTVVEGCADIDMLRFSDLKTGKEPPDDCGQCGNCDSCRKAARKMDAETYGNRYRRPFTRAQLVGIVLMKIKTDLKLTEISAITSVPYDILVKWHSLARPIVAKFFDQFIGLPVDSVGWRTSCPDDIYAAVVKKYGELPNGGIYRILTADGGYVYRHGSRMYFHIRGQTFYEDKKRPTNKIHSYCTADGVYAKFFDNYLAADDQTMIKREMEHFLPLLAKDATDAGDRLVIMLDAGYHGDGSVKQELDSFGIHAWIKVSETEDRKSALENEVQMVTRSVCEQVSVYH